MFEKTATTWKRKVNVTFKKGHKKGGEAKDKWWQYYLLGYSWIIITRSKPTQLTLAHLWNMVSKTWLYYTLKLVLLCLDYDVNQYDKSIHAS